MHPLKQAFLLAISLVSMTHAQQKTPVEKNASSKNVTVAAKFDYAFGDQCAAAMGVPGATGKNWGLSDTADALEAFLKKNPNGLKDKNVMIAIAQASMMEFFSANRLKSLLLDNIGNGRVVIMGGSEMRGGKIPGGNARIRKMAESHSSVMTYGGPIIDAPAKGSTDDIRKMDKVYPTTEQEFAFIAARAKAALQAALTPKPKSHSYNR